VAVPVASPDSATELAALADEIVILAAPANFRAVGLYYEDFHQLEDAEVVRLLASGDATRARAGGGS
jgi:predicted phosphoribosyltransferase